MLTGKFLYIPPSHNHRDNSLRDRHTYGFCGSSPRSLPIPSRSVADTSALDVRNGSLADVGAALGDVCSWGSSRHSILQLRFGVPGWREFDEIAALSRYRPQKDRTAINDAPLSATLMLA